MGDLHADEFYPPPKIIVGANDTSLAKCKIFGGVISKAPTSLLLKHGSTHGLIWHTN